MNRVLVIGATSAIAIATLRCLVSSGDRVCLVARNANRLEAVAADLRIRNGADVQTVVMDCLAFEQHETLVGDAVQRLGGIDTVLIAYGTLPSQPDCEQDFAAARRELEINALSVMSLLTYLANYMEARHSGTIAVIGSVAGDRGRQSNYVYGAAKGAVSVFLQGLRNRLQRSGVHVLTVKPGFVDTPMTASFSKGLLWAQPERVGRGICKAISKRRNVVYLPAFWYLVMFAIRSIPESLFKRLQL